MSYERVPSRSEVTGWSPQQLANYLKRVRNQAVTVSVPILMKRFSGRCSDLTGKKYQGSVNISFFVEDVKAGELKNREIMGEGQIWDLREEGIA